MSKDHTNIDRELFASRLCGFDFSTDDLSYIGMSLGASTSADQFTGYLAARFSDAQVQDILGSAYWSIQAPEEEK